METAETVIKSALQELLVQASEAPLESSEYQDGISYLNRMMNALAARGIALGYTVVGDLSDEITVPDGAIEGMVKNLAVRMFSMYSEPGLPIDPILIADAQQGLSDMRALSVFAIGPSLYPGTLPVGSGNEGDDYCVNHFYTEEDDPVLTEGGGFISVESGTEI